MSGNEWVELPESFPPFGELIIERSLIDDNFARCDEARVFPAVVIQIISKSYTITEAAALTNRHSIASDLSDKLIPREAREMRCESLETLFVFPN